MLLPLLVFGLGFALVVVGPQIPMFKKLYEEKLWFLAALMLLSIVVATGTMLTLDHEHSALETALHFLQHNAMDVLLLTCLVFAVMVNAEEIRFKGDLIGNPVTIVGFLVMAMFLAPLISTGGAVALVGPLIAMSIRQRQIPILPIMAVSGVLANSGGSFSTIGDGPMNLLPSRGVDFWWPTINLTPLQLLVCISIIAIYFVCDSIVYAKEKREAVQADLGEYQPLTVDLRKHLPFLGLVVAAPISFIFFEGWLRIATLAAIGLVGAYLSRSPRFKDEFDIEPKHADHSWLEHFVHHSLWGHTVREVFFALTVLVFLSAPLGYYLGHHPEVFESVGIDSPYDYYASTTVLSAILDNAPTSLLMLETAKAAEESGSLSDESRLLEALSVPNTTVIAIEAGAVNGGMLTIFGNYATIAWISICGSVLGKKRTPGYFSYLKVALIMFFIPLFVVPFFYFNVF